VRESHPRGVPFRVVADRTVASPNLPAGKGILALRRSLDRSHRWIED
jgi:hypothetical protein